MPHDHTMPPSILSTASASPKSPRGRPRALDDAKRRDLCALVSAGCTLEAAARYVGCVACTVRREFARDPQFATMLRAAALDAKRIHDKSVRDMANKYVRLATRLKQRAVDPNDPMPAVRLLEPEKLALAIKIISLEVREEAACERASDWPLDLARFATPANASDVLSAASEREGAEATNFAPIAATHPHPSTTPNKLASLNLRSAVADREKNQNPSAHAPGRAKSQKGPIESRS